MKKVALFGCGGFAKNHIRELSKRDDVVVQFFIDPSLENRKLLGESYKDEKGIVVDEYDNLSEFLSSNPEFDAAIIVSPPKTHFEIASAIIKIGKSVYVEKPFTINVSEAKELCRLAEEKKVEVEIGANRCVFPAYKAAAEALQEGKVGELKAVTMYYRHNWERNTRNNWRQNSFEPAAGLIADHSPHYSHFLFTDLGFKPQEVRHIGTRFNEYGVDIDICYEMKDEEGIPAYVVMDGSPSDDNREEVIKIYGSEGIIKIKFEDKSSNAYIEKDGKEERIELGKALEEIRSLGIEDFRSHPALIHNFIAVLNGEAKNANPGKEGIMPVYLTELVEKSRGDLKKDSLSKEELQELSKLVNNEGILDIKKMESFYDRGTEIQVDKGAIEQETRESAIYKEIDKKFLR
jgi:predicted dehydrogenase